MRILVFSSLYPNSVSPHLGLFVHRRAEAVSRRGVDVRVMAPVPYFPRRLPVRRWRAYAYVPARERIAGITVMHPRYLHAPGPGMYVQAASLAACMHRHVRAVQREFAFDLIDAHYVYPDGVAAVALGRALGVPVVLTARGSDINLLPQFPLVRRQIGWALRHASALVGVSGALVERMLQLGAPPDRVRTVPNGVDRSRFAYGDSAEARRSLGLYSDEILLLSVGNLNELKGHALMIEALALLRQRGVRANLHIVGEGPERRSLEERIVALDLHKQVVLQGSIPNERLGRWYQAATLFVLASSREGWPNVLNEALACGLPVVATRVGGVPEIVREPENGVFIRERSSEGIAAAVETALERRWDRQMVARQAARRGWTEVASQLVEIFATLTGRTAIPSVAGTVASSPPIAPRPAGSAETE
jgi:glycosyltransferase involved in cell wall biosynthesis